MKKITLLIMCAALLAPCLSVADEAAKNQLAGQLIETINLKRQFDKSYQNMTSQFFPMLRQQVQAHLAKDGKVDEAAKKRLAGIEKKVSDLVAKEISWPKIKGDQIKVYASTFSENELKELNDFFKTPTGQKFIEKQQDVLKASYQITQKHLQSMMPKLNKLLEEALPELKAQQQKQQPTPAKKAQ